MIASAAGQFRNPRNQAALRLQIDEEQDGQVMSGKLIGGGDEFSIVRGIPRFCPIENYSQSFGYQWTTFSKTQLDSEGQWANASERRLFMETRWPRNLAGQRILEAGSGMGRFTEVLAGTGAEICTFDYSVAVEANVRNNARFSKVCFAQANIYEPPYEHGSFDKVLCLGVLQHCPSPRKAFMSLTRFLKPGGEIVVDVYHLNWKCLFAGKYYLRPITRHLSARTLLPLVRLHVGWVYPMTGLLQKLIGRRGRSLSWVLSMADYRGVYPMSDETARELSILDTLDMLSPAYDRPATVGMIRGWLKEAGLVDIEVGPGSHTVVEARGKRLL